MKIILFLVLIVFAIEVYLKPQSEDQFQKTNNEIPTFGEDSTLEKANEWINNAIKYVTETIKKVHDHVEKMINLIKVEIKYFVEQSSRNLSEIIGNIQVQFDELNNENIDLLKCSEKYRPEIDKIFNDAELGIGTCGNDTVTKINGIQDDVRNYTNGIRENVVAMKNVTKECATINPINMVKCIFQNAGKIRETITKLIANSKNVMKGATIRFKQISIETHVCLKDVIQETQKSVNNVFHLISKCSNVDTP